MIIDATSYQSFHENMEKYRLTYSPSAGIVPASMPDGLGRGLEIHNYAEAYNNGDVGGYTPHPDTTEEQRRKAHALWPTLEDYLKSLEGKVVLAEKEFLMPIPDSHHYIAGRIDAIRTNDLLFWAEDYKTCNDRKKMYEIEAEWRANPQANFIMLGAKYLGYDVTHVDIIYIQEGTPPRCFTHRVDRTQYDLDYQVHSCKITCDIIEMLLEKYPNVPWPHPIHSQWSSDVRGACNNGWCDYKTVCGQQLSGVPEGFKKRTEHLKCVPEEGRFKK